jgi:Arc/MetJ family transcription regulator
MNPLDIAFEKAYLIHIRRCIAMRTNIHMDDTLVRKAFRLSKARTKKELVATALAEYVANHGRRDLRDLRGKIAFRRDYDYKAMRTGRAA